MSLVAWGAQEADVSSARAATREARARLPVLSPGLSLDPKPKVVRPKTKINFTKKVKCYSIPTLSAARRDRFDFATVLGPSYESGDVSAFGETRFIPGAR